MFSYKTVSFSVYPDLFVCVRACVRVCALDEIYRHVLGSCLVAYPHTKLCLRDVCQLRYGMKEYY